MFNGSYWFNPFMTEAAIIEKPVYWLMLNIVSIELFEATFTYFHLNDQNTHIKDKIEFFYLHYCIRNICKIWWAESCVWYTAQKMKFSIKGFFAFTEEILNGKLRFLCSVRKTMCSFVNDEIKRTWIYKE